MVRPRRRPRGRDGAEDTSAARKLDDIKRQLADLHPSSGGQDVMLPSRLIRPGPLLLWRFSRSCPDAPFSASKRTATAPTDAVRGESTRAAMADLSACGPRPKHATAASHRRRPPATLPGRHPAHRTRHFYHARPRALTAPPPIAPRPWPVNPASKVNGAPPSAVALLHLANTDSGGTAGGRRGRGPQDIPPAAAAAALRPPRRKTCFSAASSLSEHSRQSARRSAWRARHSTTRLPKGAGR